MREDRPEERGNEGKIVRERKAVSLPLVTRYTSTKAS